MQVGIIILVPFRRVLVHVMNLIVLAGKRSCSGCIMFKRSVVYVLYAWTVFMLFISLSLSEVLALSI